mgnify:CR=1 FL=1
MAKRTWIELKAQEQTLLLEALTVLRASSRKNKAAIDGLTLKLIHADPYPDITVGVHGGQVQWTAGNPFPIRICDYDGEKEDLPDIDDCGEPCRIWLEPSRRSV